LKDFKWVIRSKQIKDCLVTVEGVDVALKISGKNMTALKGKTTQSKPNLVAKDFVKFPVELQKLHQEVFLTVDIFFVNKIPFFLTLSQKICFTAVNHLADRTVPQIFKAFKETYQYYLHCGFCITTVHADGRGIRTPHGFDPVYAGWPNGQLGYKQRACPGNQTLNPGGKGTLPIYQTQPSVPASTKIVDNPHRVPCRKVAQFLPNEGRNIGHYQSKNHHVR
jgi:hypothetical protein